MSGENLVLGFWSKYLQINQNAEFCKKTLWYLSIGLKNVSKLNLDMNLIFFMWLGIHKYMYLIQSIHMGVVRHILTCQKQSSMLNWQYVKTALSYDSDFLYMFKHLQKQKIDSVSSSSVITVWFLNFFKKSLAANCIA